MATELVCPKCLGAMRTYESNGVNIDQCVGCRGIVPDRGEPERLLHAEAMHNQAAQPAPQVSSRVCCSIPRVSTQVSDGELLRRLAVLERGLRQKLAIDPFPRALAVTVSTTDAPATSRQR